MKYLIMAEGSDERALLEALLDKQMFLYEKKDLLYEDVIHARQLDIAIITMINQLPLEEKVVIIRVGDKLSDRLKIPKDLINKVVKQEKVCIKPELEILFIIKSGYLSEFEKQKSKKKPSEFYKSKDPTYNKNSESIKSIFLSMNENEIKSLFAEYDKKRKGAHKKDEKTIIEMIK